MMGHYVFPRWSNLLLPMLVVLALTAPLYVVYVVAFGFSPKTTDVGYEPEQPVAYSHALHAGELGIDCRYCHNTVERTAKAAIPPTQTCMNCHTQIRKDSPKLLELWRSYENGTPLRWVRVHDLPDYVYFDHSAHVNRGVSCVECHGRVDKMEVVYRAEPLSMGWCLNCHRDPTRFVRDPEDVTRLDWGISVTEEERRRLQERYGLDLVAGGSLTPDQRAVIGSFWIDENHLNPSQDCSTCHR